MKENTSLKQLVDVLATYTERITDASNEILDSDIAQNTTAIIESVGESLAEASKVIKFLKAVDSIPTKLYMRKFEQYCKGLADISLEKRQKYMNALGREKFNKESVFVLNIINRMEEEDKLPFLLKLLEAKMEGVLDDCEYRRLMVLTDRTLYSDLLYLEANITADPVSLQTDSDFGLAASGLLVTAGNEFMADFGTEDDPSDTGIRFNYTAAAKKLAAIFFGVHCTMAPSNIGVVKLQPMSANDIDKILNS